jgi:PAS domain S-box-containing protein
MKILIVDDHEIVRQGVSSLLRRNDKYEICGEAADGHEAIQKARHLQPEIVVMDISMPNLNGLEATRAIRNALPNSEVLIMSQHDSPQVVKQAFSAGARGYVVKSSLARELLNAVASVGRHEPFVDPKISGINAASSAGDVQQVLQRGASLDRAEQDSEERYRALVTMTAQLVWRCDAQGRNIWISDSQAATQDRDPESVKNSGWLEMLHPEDREHAAKVWAECVRTGAPYHHEFRCRVADGTYHYFDSRAVAIRSADGTIREWMGANFDISDRKQAEAALRANEERMRFSLEAAHFGTWDWNIVTGKTQWSENMEQVFGVAPGSFDGTFESAMQSVHADDRASIVQAIERAISGDGTYRAEYRRACSDGSYAWIESMGKVIYDDQHRPIRMMGVSMDVTGRKRIEAALLTTQSDLEKRVQERTADLELAQASLRHLSARLLQAQDEERRRIARELHDSAGQLLAALSMTLTPLELELRASQQSGADAVVSSMKLVDELSRELRTISHLLHPPMLDEAGLEFALRWYVEGFAERSEIDVEFDFPENLGRLPRDVETTIFRLIQESLTNIHRHAESPTATIRLWRENRHINVEVRDHGKGMPTEAKKGAIRTSRTGVGIQGMRERVRELGGLLDIQSDKNGTIVLARVPFQDARSAIATKAESAK